MGFLNLAVLEGLGQGLVGGRRCRRQRYRGASYSSFDAEPCAAKLQQIALIIYVVSYTPTLLALRVTLYSYEPSDSDLYLEGGEGEVERYDGLS